MYTIFLFLDLKTNVELQEKLNITPSMDFGLQHFNYSNSILMENIFSHLMDTNFTGLVVSNVTLNKIKLNKIKLN